MAADPGNTGSSNERPVAVNIYADMAAFDALPPEHRETLRNMSDNWGAGGVLKLVEDIGPAKTLATMRSIQAKAQRAYEKRLLCPVH